MMHGLISLYYYEIPWLFSKVWIGLKSYQLMIENEDNLIENEDKSIIFSSIFSLRAKTIHSAFLL